MNLPNCLSIARICSVPVIIFLMYQKSDLFQSIALVIFILAALTDLFDGIIARKKNLITDFGKFIDPIADKLLVLSTFIMLISTGQIDAWFAILVLFRELSVDGLRLIAVTKDSVIAAGKLGKVKTVSQMIFILILMGFHFSLYSNWFTILLLIWTSLITVWSGIDYFIHNRNVFH